ncbi:CHAT domain-containing protein [Mastigocladus laminosus UU774]|nr:CHAT domain-containing protein [Mastigocladus laminosus UU774]
MQKRYKFINLIFLITLLTGFVPFNAGLTTVSASLIAQTTTRQEADRIFKQGVKQYKAKQLQSASTSWQQALTAYRTLKDHPGEATTLKNLSAVYIELADYPQAIAHLQQYLNLTRELGDRQGEQAALVAIADIYVQQENYAKAIEYYQQGLIVVRNSQQSLEEAIILGNLAKAYRILGKYNTAIELNQKALQISRTLKDRKTEAKVLINLGNAYKSLGDYDSAFKSFQESWQIAREVKDTVVEAIALGNLGAAAADQRKYDQAIAFHEQSLKISESINDAAGKASTLINLGSNYYSLGDRTKALSYYQQALEFAKAAKNNKLEAEALGSLGLAYEDLQQYPQAIQHQQQSLAIFQKIGDPAAQGMVFNNLGHAFFSAGKLNEAESQLRNSIKLLDNLRLGLSDTYKVSIFDTQVSTYNLLQQILISAKKPEAALEVSEQGRARAFAELLARKLTTDTVKANSSVKSVAYSSSVDAAPNIEKIRQIARQQNATLVEYTIIPDDDFKFRGKQRGREQELFIWVVQPNGKVDFRRRDLKFLWQTEYKSLENLVKNSRKFMGVNDSRGIISAEVTVDQQSQKKQLQQLHEILVSPIADLLPSDSKANVVFIPQESLFLVPFPALQDKNGKYLIEQHTILTAPSIQVLDLTRILKENRNRQRGENLSALIVGNPTPMPSLPKIQLKALPNAEKEANEIATLLKTNALIGKQATKTNVLKQLPKSRFVHLATHGLLEYGSQNGIGYGEDLGIPGALALAPNSHLSEEGNQESNGLLTADEIINLSLNAELVVLSACSTGEGRISGDGVIGLSRSFISAGTESVLVSLWSVPDAPTAKLMTEFYRQLQQNNNKAQSLRDAMLKLVKQYPDTPKNWAAFTLIGEAR